MEIESLLAEQQTETRKIIDELLNDGSDPAALYIIEHHLSSEHFDVLEKAAVEAFKLGYEVTDPEELELDDGSKVICVDVIGNSALNSALIDIQVGQLVALAARFHIEYDGWGTYYEDPDGDVSDEDENEEDRI